MLEQLKFVQGSVAKQDLIPELTHFSIEKGTVRGYNGTLALCSPIALDIECKPQAAPLIKAIGNCQENIKITLSSAGNLLLKSGNFKASIKCITGDSPHVLPEGEDIELDGEILLKAMKVLYPFIGGNSSHPWSNGVLFGNGSAFATNNIIAIEYWTGIKAPRAVNIPKAAVKEMIRIDEPATRIQLGQSSITFHYSGDRWLRTQLLDLNWPDLRSIFDAGDFPLINEKLFEGLKTVKPFVDHMRKCVFSKNKISVTNDGQEIAAFEIEDFKEEGIFNIDSLMLLEGVAEHVDFSRWPLPCPFFGERLRGVVVGMRE